MQEFPKEGCDVGADAFISSKSPASGPVISCVVTFYFGRSEVTKVGVASLVSIHGDVLLHQAEVLVNGEDKEVGQGMNEIVEAMKQR